MQSIIRGRLAIVGLASTLIFGGAVNVLAAPITVSANDLTDDFQVAFNGSINQTLQAGLTGSATFNFTGATNVGANTVFSFNVTLSNTSSSPITASRISAIGWTTDPNLIIASSTVSAPWEIDDGSQFPSSFPNTIEICVSQQASGNCGGGGNGVLIGQSAAFTLGLAVAGNNVSSLTFDGFGVRYQSISGGTGGNSGAGAGTSTPTPPPPTPVPEPASLFLFGSGLIVAVRQLRRRQQA